jgi:hypothetical protein
VARPSGERSHFVQDAHVSRQAASNKRAWAAQFLPGILPHALLLLEVRSRTRNPSDEEFSNLSTESFAGRIAAGPGAKLAYAFANTARV